jgi:hypothetical protein
MSQYYGFFCGPIFMFFTIPVLHYLHFTCFCLLFIFLCFLQTDVACYCPCDLYVHFIYALCAFTYCTVLSNVDVLNHSLSAIINSMKYLFTGLNVLIFPEYLFTGLNVLIFPEYIVRTVIWDLKCCLVCFNDLIIFECVLNYFDQTAHLISMLFLSEYSVFISEC